MARPDKSRDIVATAKAVLAYAHAEAAHRQFPGRLPPELDTRALRRRLKLSQRAFAKTFGFDLARVRSWERGRALPTGAEATLLKVIAREPAAAARALIR